MSRKSKAQEFVDEGYKIHVTGRNVLVTDAMKQYAIEKIEKIERFSDRLIDVVVTMDIQKLEHRVDISMRVGHIKIKGSAASTDMYVSIDQAVDKISEQLRRYKTRLQDHQAKGLKVIDMNVNVIRANQVDELVEINDEIEEENLRRMEKEFQPHEVVMQEKRPLKVLNLDEAVMKMELSGDSFMIFKSEENHHLNVIYRRNDGNYGVIEAESGKE